MPAVAIAEGVPTDLAELCMDLLQIDPACRPEGPEILVQLKAGLARAVASKQQAARKPPTLDVIALGA